MRVGIFGGSFDPFHQGHLQPVLAVQEALGLDRVVYLVTANPPHKPGEAMASPHHRFAMAELALLPHPDLQVSDLELTPGTPSYTVDTVAELQRRSPGDQLFLLLGVDSFTHLHTWRRWSELVARVELAVMARPGWQLDNLPPETSEELVRLAASPRVHRIEGSPQDLSSTQVRRLLRSGLEPPEGALPDLVLRYIRKYALYS